MQAYYLDAQLPNYEKLTTFFSTVHWKHGWHSTIGKEDPAFFNINFDVRDLPTEVEAAYAVISTLVPGKLTRCYANMQLYGVEGYPHKDSPLDNMTTVVVYICDTWQVDWGGETVVYSEAQDIIASCMPRPNRFFMFRGNQLHQARSVTRKCVVPRITLMFKVDNV